MGKGLSFEEIENTTPSNSLRFTATKCCISGEYGCWGNQKSRNGLELKRDRYGRIKISWSSHVPVKTTEREKCDLGHSHMVEKEEKFVWDYVTLTSSECKQIAAFLLGSSE